SCGRSWISRGASSCSAPARRSPMARRRRWRRIRTSSTSTSARPWSAARVLEIDGLQAGYGDVRMLFGVTLSVGAGEIVALLGPNGAGKSTLLNCVAGLVRPRSGAIRWDGQDLRTLGAHLIVERGVALVPEGRRLFGGMTVQENLELGAFASRAWGAGAPGSSASTRCFRCSPSGGGRPCRRS